jgi:hypothetical protein
VSVEFTPTPFAPEEYDVVAWSTGPIVPQGEQRGPWLIPLSLGTAQFSVLFDHETAMLGGHETRIQVPHPTLFLQLGAGNRFARIDDLFSAIEEELDDFARLLSFFSRQRVGWYHVGVDSLVPDSHTKPIQRSERWRAVFGSTSESRELRQLVWPGRLNAADLGDMFKNLRRSPYREALVIAIAFLIDTFGDRWLEERATSAFTALETIVAGINQVDNIEYILDEDTFNALRKQIRATVKSLDAQGVTRDQRRAIYAKLPELNRPPIVPAMVRVAKRFGVNTARIWRIAADVEQVLGKAYGRRSALTHTGRLVDPEATVVDYPRVHALAEQIIYKMLGARDQWLDYSAYYHVPQEWPDG